jgi:hypothetical protein
VTERLTVIWFGGAVAPTAHGRGAKPGKFTEARGYPAPATGDPPIRGFLLETLSLFSQGRVFGSVGHPRPFVSAAQKNVPSMASPRFANSIWTEESPRPRLPTSRREPVGFTYRRSP